MPTLFLKNTETFAESLARCGVKYHFAYPITPATDIMKRMAVILPQYGGKMVQMESELAVSSALAGAACTGTLCATSTSGPGMTLMQEAMGFMAAAELPCLLVDSMRVGPGDGDILGAQSDYYLATRGGGHGDYRLPVLAPADGQEIVGLVPEGIRLAYTYRTPVLFVLDGTTAQTTETADLPGYRDYSALYDTSGWAFTGTQDHPKRALITGSYAHEDAYKMNERLRAKCEAITAKEQRWQANAVDDAELIVVAFGIHGRAPSFAIGYKMCRPDNIVFTYAGDGDTCAIGLGDLLHAANKGLAITTIMVNNTVFGMTGGQMSPTTLEGQVTATTPRGRDVTWQGYPLLVPEMMRDMPGVKYLARETVADHKRILAAKRSIKKAFECQVRGLGYAFVEVVVPCPTGLKMSVKDAYKWCGEKMVAYFKPQVFKNEME